MPAPTASPESLSILYVEDNPIVREVTAELLMADYPRVTSLATAEEALREYWLQSFDLLITDISLPVMSGLDLARTILSSKADAPIIIASGYAVDLKPRSLGPRVRCIVKPFDGPAIDALIREVCYK